MSRDRVVIVWAVETMRKKLPFSRYTRQQEDSHQDPNGKHRRIWSWCEIGNQVLTLRTAEDEEQIDLHSVQLTFIRLKQRKCHKSEAIRCSH